MLEREVPSAEAMHALGVAVGRAAFPGAVVALQGDLGAGKTVFAQGVGEGLGCAGPVTSPTFALVDVHDDGRLDLVHADLYRLDDPRELDQIGLEELLEGDGVGVVEWCDRAPDVLPLDHLRLDLTHAGAGRVLAARATGPRHAALLEVLRG